MRGSIPRWLFDFQVAVNRWHLRTWSYFLLLTDVYPPFDGDYPIRYEVPYPERVSRWRLVVWKIITSIPHLIILAVLALTVVVVTAIAWFAILLTGSYPKGLHGYTAGVLRWGARVQAYVISLTDEFPPFSLSPDAGPAERSSYVISFIIGLVAVGGIIAGLIALAAIANNAERVTVSYEALLTGGEQQTEAEVGNVQARLIGAEDPADDDIELYVPDDGHRFVAFQLSIWNKKLDSIDLDRSDFHLKDSAGDSHEPFLAILAGRPLTQELDNGKRGMPVLVFEIAQDVEPEELRYRPGLRSIIWEFR